MNVVNVELLRQSLEFIEFSKILNYLRVSRPTGLLNWSVLENPRIDRHLLETARLFKLSCLALDVGGTQISGEDILKNLQVPVFADDLDTGFIDFL